MTEGMVTPTRCAACGRTLYYVSVGEDGMPRVGSTCVPCVRWYVATMSALLRKRRMRWTRG